MKIDTLTPGVKSLVYFVCLTLTLFDVDARNLRSLSRENTLCKGGSVVDIEGDAGVKIEPIEQSKVYIDTLSEPFDDGHTFRFEFKTHSGNGTLFYAVRRNDVFDMVSAEIRDGYVQFKVRCKSSYADLTIPKFRVNDGEWHKIKFHRKRRKGIFMLDDMEFFEQYYVGCQGFTSLNFGNTNSEHDDSISVQELQPKNGQFEGCIRRVEISTGIETPPKYTAISLCN
ncbi:basement membrane proteoglycan-like [Mya arenaria]|uniref:basement membrane proteoglycan-like n=1 Tax=Mya arenaria TaxID=6604 RepID=UPI0022E2E5F6|nr:basement membrane proteoglycan-like [Mya arenaria]